MRPTTSTKPPKKIDNFKTRQDRQRRRDDTKMWLFLLALNIPFGIYYGIADHSLLLGIGISFMLPVGHLVIIYFIRFIDWYFEL